MSGGPRAERDSRERATVLVVDDDPLQRELTQLRLEQAGFRIETASSGQQALSKLRTVGAELIVSDVRMPGMDGFQLCLAIRKDEALRRLPVVLLSGSHEDEMDLNLAKLVGVTAVLSRDQQTEQIVETLVKCLGTDSCR